jgi:pimeloyl-ACP methyl ester carboxylesterase
LPEVHGGRPTRKRAPDSSANHSCRGNDDRNLISIRQHRRLIDLLSRSRAARRADGPSVARISLILSHLPTNIDSIGERMPVVAPDHPGFGHSDAPDPKKFVYTFDHLAEVIGCFSEELGLTRYSLFLQDYGGPVGFRLALAHPERLQALIIQNAVAHEDGLGPLWVTRRAFWTDREAHETALRKNFLSLAATRQRHIGRSPRPWAYDPDLWTDEFAFLSRPGQADIQSDLFYDYRTNVSNYPAWQAWLRNHRPKLLVLWGRYDPSFEVAEAQAYRRDLSDAEIHILDAGHFALDEKADEIAEAVRCFLRRVSKT